MPLIVLKKAWDTKKYLWNIYIYIYLGLLLILHYVRSGAVMVEDRTIMRGRVTVYSVPGCPHCIQAKAALSTLGVPVCDVDVNKHREIRAQLKELTGRSTVPQIFFNNMYVGNNEDLQKLVR